MANWCSNIIDITGSQSELQRLLDMSYTQDPIYSDDPDALLSNEELLKRDVDFTFHGVAPVPAEILKAGFGINDSAGYHWQVDNWGTKWSPAGVQIDFASDESNTADTNLSIWFDTAWSPALQWADKVAAEFPTIEMSYRFFEPGTCIAGVAEYGAGKRTLLTKYKHGSVEYNVMGYDLMGYEPEEDEQEH